MSEVTLHGYPVKVGDRVWNYSGLDLEVVYDDDSRDESKHDIIKLSNISVNEHALLWQPIDPAAIEAAKVKKEPEYEWQWLYKDNGLYHTTNRHYKSDYEFEVLPSAEKLYRIEESKREVKP